MVDSVELAKQKYLESLRKAEGVFHSAFLKEKQEGRGHIDARDAASAASAELDSEVDAAYLALQEARANAKKEIL